MVMNTLPRTIKHGPLEEEELSETRKNFIMRNFDPT